jgi:hypothetical protein
MTPQKVIFFSPFAGIWLHAMPEALVAKELQRAGADVTYVTCDGILASGCAVMSAHSMPAHAGVEERERICAMCRKQRDMIVSALGVESVTIESLVDDAARTEVREMVAKVTEQTITDVTVEDLPVGRYALHETVIHFKLSDLSEMTPAAFEHFKVDLKHTLLAMKATRAILERFRPQRIVTYNTHYSLNFAMMNLAERQGVAVYGLHASNNMAKRMLGLYVFRRDMVILYRDMIRRFEEQLYCVPAHATGITDATDHFIGLTSAGSIFVYSAPRQRDQFNVREFFGIGDHQKVLLATLSSYDELYSSQVLGVMEKHELMFPTQVEWIAELIAWARARPDVFLIIRVHPREFPNRRDSVHSTHAKRLAAEFDSLPPNVRINWPTDNVSLYDVATEVDVGLNGWSSAGKELSLLGIPVVLFTKDILYYPSSLNMLGTTRAHYFQLIDQALASGWSLDRVRNTYRWLAIEYNLSTVDISDGFSYSEARTRTLARRIRDRVMRHLDPWRTQRTNLRALHRPLRNGRTFVRAILEDIPVIALQLEERKVLAARDENRLLRAELERILQQAYPDTPASRPLMQRLHSAVPILESDA